YCSLSPREGARLLVAECCRNLSAVGAVPVAATNNLNFGNPERPEIMAQLVEAIEGMAEACRFFEVPITGGNVSLYNETDGKAIYPTPIIGVVGLIEDATTVLGRSFRSEGSDLVLFGTSDANLGGSEYLKTMHGVVAGEAPHIDLDAERALLSVMTAAARQRLVQSAHDCSDGGLAIALAECAFDSGGIGCEANIAAEGDANEWGVLGALFSERGGRILVSVRPEQRDALLALARASGVPATVIGRTGGNRIRVAISGTTIVDCPVAEAEQVWATAFERHFAGRAA
ncbi:MAG: AIR synthase-related protein, partial [Vicinamibacterales bacterium]